MGMNQAKVALVIGLANAGGAAPTSQLIAATGVGKMTALRHLRQMAERGYVSTSEPVREGRESIWVLNHGALKADAEAFIAAVTPKAGGGGHDD